MLILGLEVSETYAFGDEIEVQLALLNNADTTASINSFIDVSNALKTSIFLITGPEGERMDYHGMYAKGADSSIQLLPKENRTFTVMLAKEYYLPTHGTYTVKPIVSNILLANSDWKLNKGSAEFTVVTEYDDYALPAVTRAQEETLHMKRAHSKCEYLGVKNKVCGATDEQKLLLIKAYNAAEAALSYISSQDSAVLTPVLKPSHEEVFCAANTSSWAALHRNYSAMLAYIEGGVIYRFDGAYCTSTTFAYVFQGHTRDVFLCALYNKAPELPNTTQLYDTKLGTIIHEVSHKAVSSQDHFYSYELCKQEAAVCNVSRTTTNADCIQFFAEFAYLNGVANTGIAGEASKDVAPDEL